MLFNKTSRASAQPKTVVLTGASSGIGRATALAFARDGANLVLAARGRPGLDSLATECEALGAQVLVKPVDVSDALALRTLVHAAITRFDGIDVWINNVGVGAVGAFDTTPMDSHRRVIESNLIGHMNGAHAVLPHFRVRRRGTLINMISVGGWAPSPYAASYAASKFGLRGFSESLRAEVANVPGVHVCDIYPTFVDTPGLMHGANYSGKNLRPPPPLLDPREVADAIVALSKSPRPVTSVGSVAWPARIAHALAPQLTGRMAAKLAGVAFNRAKPAVVTDGNLFTPSQGNAIDGGYRMPANKRGQTAVAALAVAGMVGLGLLMARQKRRLTVSRRLGLR
ncbi:MAG: short-chain dehydrogenase/reductase [Polaromonas sp.]|jgi:short-subunit dehydrogenase|nr:short-chain dehydrogenase/reductase [Polaromonas sp.]